MASAASRTCFSTALISRSRAEARVGVGCAACGSSAFVDCPRALRARMSVAAKIRSEFIRVASSGAEVRRRIGQDVWVNCRIGHSGKSRDPEAVTACLKARPDTNLLQVCRGWLPNPGIADPQPYSLAQNVIEWARRAVGEAAEL